MNFGFGREELHPTTPSPVQTRSQHEERDDTSSSVSTPLGTYTGTESDFSSLKDIELEFPQPPSIGPMIRRMQSSPSFAESSNAFSEHCTTMSAHLFRHTSSWGRTVSEQQLGTPNEVSLSSTFQTTDERTDSLSKELEVAIDHESLILNAVNTSCAARWQKNHRASETDPHLPLMSSLGAVIRTLRLKAAYLMKRITKILHRHLLITACQELYGESLA